MQTQLPSWQRTEVALGRNPISRLEFAGYRALQRHDTSGLAEPFEGLLLRSFYGALQRDCQWYTRDGCLAATLPREAGRVER